MTLREHVNPDVQIVVCVLSNNKKDRYDAIKKFCCITCPGKLGNMIQYCLKLKLKTKQNFPLLIYCFNGPFYNMICLICFTVPSQMVVSRTLNKAKQLMSVATKIAIQMNCKMGGVVWAVPIPVSIAVAILIEGKWMLS